MTINKDKPLVEQTQKKILEYISSHKNDSNKLPKEQEFVELLGVSRVVVREALSRLKAIGLIETKRKQGTTIAKPEVFGTLRSIVSSGLLDRNTLKDLYQLRIMLEIGMADFIYMYKTDKLVDELDAIVAEEVSLENAMQRANSEEKKYAIAKKLTNVDIRFHSKLFEMTGNKSIMDFQYILRHLFSLYFPKIDTDYHNRTIVSHVSLFNLLKKGTPDAFRMAMRLHLNTQLDNMEKIIDNTFNK